jgi:hypothetical protein
MTPQLTVLAGEDRELTNGGGINAFLETAGGAIFKNYLYTADAAFPIITNSSQPFRYPASTFERGAAGRPFV